MKKVESYNIRKLTEKDIKKLELKSKLNQAEEYDKKRDAFFKKYYLFTKSKNDLPKEERKKEQNNFNKEALQLSIEYQSLRAGVSDFYGKIKNNILYTSKYDKLLKMVQIPFGKVLGKGFLEFKEGDARAYNMLENFALKCVRYTGEFKEVVCPDVIKKEHLVQAGVNPKFLEEYFKIEGEDLYLCRTAEIFLLQYSLRGEYLFAVTDCYRKEIGHRATLKGINRANYFRKVEGFARVKDRNTEKIAIEKIMNLSHSIIESLELRHQIRVLTRDDIANQSELSVDIEILIEDSEPVEIASISTCGDYQSRRSKTNGITLNGTLMSLNRVFSSVISKYGAVSEKFLSEAYEKFKKIYRESSIILF